MSNDEEEARETCEARYDMIDRLLDTKEGKEVMLNRESRKVRTAIVSAIINIEAPRELHRRIQDCMDKYYQEEYRKL